VLDREDLNAAARLVDSVDDAVVAAPRAVQPFQAKLKRLPTRRGLAASDAYRNSTTAVAIFSGSLCSARRAGAVQAMA
jgi:hypothetical protein